MKKDKYWTYVDSFRTTPKSKEMLLQNFINLKSVKII